MRRSSYSLRSWNPLTEDWSLIFDQGQGDEKSMVVKPLIDLASGIPDVCAVCQAAIGKNVDRIYKVYPCWSSVTADYESRQSTRTDADREANSGNTVPRIKRSRTFRSIDADIHLLSRESKGFRTRFSIHNQLAILSPVWKRLLQALPTDSEGAESSCPTLELDEDPEHLDSLLMVLYDSYQAEMPGTMASVPVRVYVEHLALGYTMLRKLQFERYTAAVRGSLR